LVPVKLPKEEEFSGDKLPERIKGAISSAMKKLICMET
jgi:hypothetical protein